MKSKMHIRGFGGEAASGNVMEESCLTGPLL